MVRRHPRLRKCSFQQKKKRLCTALAEVRKPDALEAASASLARRPGWAAFKGGWRKRTIQTATFASAIAAGHGRAMVNARDLPLAA